MPSKQHDARPRIRICLSTAGISVSVGSVWRKGTLADLLAEDSRIPASRCYCYWPGRHSSRSDRTSGLLSPNSEGLGNLPNF